MKYLLLTKHRGAFSELPLEKVRAAKAYIDARRKRGVIEAIYVFPGGGGITIFNAASHKALMDDLTSYPLFNWVEFEVRPLVEVDDYFAKALGAGKRARP